MEVHWAHRTMASSSSALPLVEKEKELFPLKTVSSVVSLFESVLKRTSQPDLALFSIICGYFENTLTCNPNLIQAASQQHQLQQQLQQQQLQQTSISNKASSALLSSEPSTIISTGTEKCLTATFNANDADDFPPVELDIIEALYIKFRAIIKSSVDLNLYGSPVYATRELVKKVSDVIWNTLTRTYYKDRAHLQSIYSYLTGNKLDCFGVALAVVAACQVLSYNDVHLALSEDHAWVTFGEDGRETAEVTWHGKGNEDKRGQPVDMGIQARSWLYVAGKPVVCSRFTELAALISSINPSISATIDCIEVSLLQQSLLWLLYDNNHLDQYPMALGNLADLEELNPTSGRVHCSQLFDQAIAVARRYYDNRHVYPYTYQGGYYYRNRLYKEALESWANAADVIRAYNYSREDEEIYKEFLEIANELIPYVMKVEGSGHSARSILKDPECFAHLLRFYDGICQWEEGSTTPVLHIGWAKPLVNTISKFDARVRGLVAISCSNDPIDETNPSDSFLKQKTAEGRGVEMKDANANEVLVPWPPDAEASGQKQEEEAMPRFLASQSVAAIVGSGAETGQDEQPRIDVAALTDLCGRTLLSPAFFLGTQCQRPVLDSSEATLTVAGIQGSLQRSTTAAGIGTANNANENQLSTKAKPRLYLRSHKMAGLKDLLLAEKLNTHAISLQLTAQSQVQLGGRGKLRENAEPKDGVNKTNEKDPGARGESHSTPVPSRPKRNRKE